MDLLLIEPVANLLPLADTFDDHHDWGGGWWVVMGLGIVLFWGLVIAGAVWLIRELSSGRHSGRGRHQDSDALGILDRRLAAGEISIDEYEKRRRALLDADRHGG